MVLAENHVGKIPLGRPHLRREDMVKRDLESLNVGPDRKTKADNRAGWRFGCFSGWS